MARLLLNLRGVPEDEADDVRALLDGRGIAYYETRPGPLHITAGAIWVRHDADYPIARSVMSDYQSRRAEEARREHERRVREGTAETLLSSVRRRPLPTVLYLGVIVALLYFAIRPFFGIAG